MPLSITGVLLVVLLVIGFAFEKDDAAAPAPAPATASVATIAKRVEAIRGLRFSKLPEPGSVSADQARTAGLADLDRTYPAAARAADEELYALVGLLPEGFDLRKAVGSIFGEGVAGYYDPRSKELKVVEGAATSGRVLTEYILSHELNHALEDQRFSLELERAEGSGDAALAYLALIEGSATAVMGRYLEKHFRSDEALAGVLGSAFQPQPDLPPFLTSELIFPYISGAQFVQELYASAGDRWTLVDAALENRPPDTTEQILHPIRYLRFEKAVEVAPSRALAACCKARTSGTFGEFQTGEMLALAGRRAPGAAAGWGGDRYELARRADGTDVLVMRWVWDTRRDAGEFAAALRRWAEDGIGARPAGRDRWLRKGAGGLAVDVSGKRVTLAFDGSPAAAAGLVSEL